MKKSKKIAVITALALIASGFIIVSVASLFTAGNNLALPFISDNPITVEESHAVQTINIDESFNNIVINEIDAKVKILPLESGYSKIKYQNTRTVLRSVSVDNGTLILNAEERGNFWDHIGIFWESPVTEIYVSKDKFDKIHIETVSGNIEITTKLTANSFHTSTTSGHTHIHNLTADSFSAESVSGEIELGNSGIRYAVINGSSGGFYAPECEFSSLYCDTVSGGIALHNSTAAEKATLSAISGTITFSKFDSAYVDAETVSGDINGTFIKPMNIYAESTSGEINIRSRDPGGAECELSTVSGNIVIY